MKPRKTSHPFILQFRIAVVTADAGYIGYGCTQTRHRTYPPETVVGLKQTGKLLIAVGFVIYAVTRCSENLEERQPNDNRGQNDLFFNVPDLNWDK